MKTRIEVLSGKTVDEILLAAGYEKDVNGKYWMLDGMRYKIAWIHHNSWGQLSYIDLLAIN